MLRPQVLRPTLAAASRLARPPTHLLRINRPLQPLLPLARHYAAYPKEGVFQPNSPPRNIPGFGPAPPSPHQSLPAQPLDQVALNEQAGGSRFRRWLPTFRWYKALGAVVFVLIGFYQVQSRLLMFIPIEQDSEEDAEELEMMWEELEELPIVQQLRSAEKFVEGEGYKPVWREWTAYSAWKDDGRKAKRLTTGPLGGSAGVAAQKVFWNEELSQMFLFINFGAATQGWPQTVHGGAISTICDEGLGRVAIRSTKANTAVTASLDVQFIDRVHPGQWHVLVAGIDAEREAECTDRKVYVQGVLGCCGDNGPTKEGDTVMELHPHAVAKGLFVVPKSVPLASLPDEW